VIGDDLSISQVAMKADQREGSPAGSGRVVGLPQPPTHQSLNLATLA
jgi:hypothetical protein